MKNLNPTIVRELLKNPDKMTEQQAAFFNQKRRTLLDKFAAGFCLANSDGDFISCEFTMKEFDRYYKQVHEVRVYTRNPDWDLIATMDDYVTRQKRLASGLDSYHLHQLQTSLGYFRQKTSRTTCKYMSPKEYEKFYKSGKEHWVDFCNENFFIEFPNAKRAADRPMRGQP